jgi:hypothetical protein
MNSIDAHCFSCGYDRLLNTGGLISNFHVYSAGPVNCESCSEITTANYKAMPLTCEVCNSSSVLPINDPTCRLGDEDSGFDGLGGILLPLATNLSKRNEPSLLGHYKCPKCGKFELRFGTNFMGHGFRNMD